MAANTTSGGSFHVIISSSLRKGSNSEALAEAFADGAAEAGNEVELLSLAGKQLAFCRGCLACQQLGRCVIDDDANAIARKMEAAEVIVFATQFGQVFADKGGTTLTATRAVKVLTDETGKAVGMRAEDAEGVDERAVHGLGGWIECFERCRLAGTVFAGGVTEPGTIQGHPALETARAMGAAIA